MSLVTGAQTVLASMIANQPEFAVAVVIQGVSGSGFSVGLNAATDFGSMGETGTITATVRVSKADFPNITKPEDLQGKTILIGGKSAIVQSVEGVALWVIRYQQARVVE
jgi:hypothetical protein